MRLIEVDGVVYNADQICCIRRFDTQVLNPKTYTMDDKKAIRIYCINNEGFTSAYDTEAERDAAYEKLLSDLQKE